jgi:hypothetical protein
LHQLVRSHNVDDPFSAGVGLHEVLKVQSRLSEKVLPSLLLKGQEASLDCADTGGRDVSILGLKLIGIIARILGHGAEVLEVEK